MAQTPQYMEANKSPQHPPSMLYISRTFPRTLTWQQMGQRQTGIQSPHPHSCFSTVAFWAAIWQVAQIQEMMQTLQSEKQSHNPVSQLLIVIVFFVC